MVTITMIRIPTKIIVGFPDDGPEKARKQLRHSADVVEASERNTKESWQCLDLLAEIGSTNSTCRQGWEILIRVHGFPAVLKAVARCYWMVAPFGKVANEQAQSVLDGNLPKALRYDRGQRMGKDMG